MQLDVIAEFASILMVQETELQKLRLNGAGLQKVEIAAERANKQRNSSKTGRHEIVAANKLGWII